MNFVRNNKALVIIIIVGLIARIIFTLFIAKDYFGRDNIQVDGDTYAWLNSFLNLWKHGSYTINFHHDYGYFFRMPGYSFFIGIIYLLAGNNPDIAFPLISWIQIILDVFSIYLIYKIGLKVFEKKRIALILSVIYSFYPFIIVWNPVVYSESISIFFMLLSLYYFTSNNKYKFYLTGIFVSLALLNRPQIALLVPVIMLVIIVQNHDSLKRILKFLFQFSLMIFLVYGSWPIRNYVNHNKLIYTQDLRGAENWNEDVVSFLQYTYSVKAEWDPQMRNILQNKKVIFPDIAYITKEDSLKLEKAIYLSQNCGSGFSNWRGYWKEPITGDNCNKEIAKIFTELRENQIKDNPINFYLILPLTNLKKAIFKANLYDQSTFLRRLASKIFYYRTLLIIFGILGAFLLMFRVNNKIHLIFILFPILLYFALCFGTSPQFRNIEMRYFLPADIILLIPASYFLNHMLLIFKNKKV